MPWLSATLSRLSKRERLTVAGGGTVSIVAVLAVFVVLPGARQWLDREAEIELRAEQVARLQALIDREEAIRRRVGSLEEARATAGRRLLEGETAAVAASNLQVLLNRYASESRLVLDRVDAVTRRQGGDGIVEIPARIAVRGDVFGLVDLLFYLQHGEKLLVIDDLRVDNARGAVTGDQLLSMSVSLHGYHRGPGGAR